MQQNFIPIVNDGALYVNGCKGAWASATTRTIAAGQVRDDTNTFDIVVSAPLTLSSVAKGAGGLDTGTVTDNTVYAIYVLYDETQTNLPALLMSASFTAPVMPSLNGVTYSSKRLVDFTVTDGSANFLLDYNFNTNSSLIYKQFDAPITVLNAGAATTPTAVSLAAYLPANITGRVKVQTSYVPHAAADTASIKPNGATAETVVLTGIVASVAQPDVFDLLPSSTPSLNYELSSGTSPAALTIKLLGAEFFV